MSPVDRFVDRLGLPVHDRALLRQALTHSSWQHEHRGEAVGHNERLEQLGDSVVSLIISEALYQRYPNDDEGSLSARRAAIVSTAGLARLAERIELGGSLLLGEGERQQRGPMRPSLLASAFEAVAGALFLDAGWEATRAWLLELAEPELARDEPIGTLKSPKSRLQELTQRSTGVRPMYRLVDSTGPDHDKRFRIEVVVEDEVLGAGVGPSRREAETEAAAVALSALGDRNTDGVPNPAGVPNPDRVPTP